MKRRETAREELTNLHFNVLRPLLSARLQFLVPSRGLMGFRSELKSQTSGQAVVNSLFSGYKCVQVFQTPPSSVLVFFLSSGTVNSVFSGCKCVQVFQTAYFGTRFFWFTFSGTLALPRLQMCGVAGASVSRFSEPSSSVPSPPFFLAQSTRSSPGASVCKFSSPPSSVLFVLFSFL